MINFGSKDKKFYQYINTESITEHPDLILQKEISRRSGATANEVCRAMGMLSEYKESTAMAALYALIVECESSSFSNMLAKCQEQAGSSGWCLVPYINDMLVIASRDENKTLRLIYSRLAEDC